MKHGIVTRCALLLAVPLWGCGEAPNVGTEETREQAQLEAETEARVLESATPVPELAAELGYDELYVVEGDILTTSREAFAHRVVNDTSLGDFASLGDDKLIGHAIPPNPTSTNVNNMMRWDGRKWTLTYCIDNEWSNYGKQQVIAAMAQATAAWEATAGVNFTYRPEYDYRCNLDTDDEVTFRVVFTNNPWIILLGIRAAAFFPDETPSSRTLVVSPLGIDPQFLEPNDPGYTLLRILTHEIGHVLGFRHEHIRTGTDCTNEPEPWIELTPYDRNSIMAYPGCDEGYVPSPTILTSLDRQGALKAYPKTANPTLLCGDGIRQAVEACDDGNNVSNDGCSEGCLRVENGFACAPAGAPCRMIHCGNGVLDPLEDCDGTPGCPSTCAWPTYDPAHPNGSFCTASGYRCGVGEGDCDTNADCLNGLVCGQDVGDMYGLPTGWDVCVRNLCPAFTTATPSGSFCLHPGCDCGQGQGDCDSDAECAPGLYCKNDAGPAWGLPAGFDVCVRPVCGNAQIEMGETCDDGNHQSGDGCSSSCHPDQNVCGNGVVGPGEECDDGNSNPNDGCHNCVEIPWCLPHSPNCDL